jgi:hypothetical protein
MKPGEASERASLTGRFQTVPTFVSDLIYERLGRDIPSYIWGAWERKPSNRGRVRL